MGYTATREHVIELLDRLPPDRVGTVAELLERMLDPVTRAQEDAPFEDEVITEEEEREVALARAETGPTIPMEDVLAEYGLTLEALRKMDFSQPAVEEKGR